MYVKCCSVVSLYISGCNGFHENSSGHDACPTVSWVIHLGAVAFPFTRLNCQVIQYFCTADKDSAQIFTTTGDMHLVDLQLYKSGRRKQLESGAA